MTEPERYGIEDLCRHTGLTRRTVRYYIQEGLLPRPEGERRGAWYTAEHLRRLRLIREWSGAGLSLDAIRGLLERGEAGLPDLRPGRPGTLEVRSHLTIAEGVELVVSPERVRLSPGQLRQLLRQVTDIYQQLHAEDNDEHI